MGNLPIINGWSWTTETRWWRGVGLGISMPRCTQMTNAEGTEGFRGLIRGTLRRRALQLDCLEYIPIVIVCHSDGRCV